MSVYSWPSAIVPKRMRLQIVPTVHAFTSPYSQQTQAIDLLSEIWRMQIDIPDGVSAVTGGQIEALFDRLKGQANQMELWNFKRPVPVGNARGVMTLSANAAQLANTVAITGAFNRNLIHGGGFQLDSNSDGTSDGWTNYTTGAGATYAFSHYSTGLGYFTTSCQGLYVSNFASRSIGLLTGSALLMPGQQYTFALDSYCSSASTTIAIYIAFYNVGGTMIGDFLNSWPCSTGGIVRRSLTGLSPPGTTYALAYVWFSDTTASSILFSNAQFEQGASPTPFIGTPTLLAGDMLGIGGQLVRVMADATADDMGNFASVEFAPRLRAAKSSGASVAWSAPTANFILSNASAPVDWTPGMYAGPQVEFVEAV